MCGILFSFFLFFGLFGLAVGSSCKPVSYEKNKVVTGFETLPGNKNWTFENDFNVCLERCCQLEDCYGVMVRAHHHDELKLGRFRCFLYACPKNGCGMVSTTEDQVVMVMKKPPTTTQTTTEAKTPLSSEYTGKPRPLTSRSFGRSKFASGITRQDETSLTHEQGTLTSHATIASNTDTHVVGSTRSEESAVTYTQSVPENGRKIPDAEKCSAKMWFKKANITNQVLLETDPDWFVVKTFTECADVCCSTQGCTGYAIRRALDTTEFKCRMFGCTNDDCQVELIDRKQAVILIRMQNQTTLAPTVTTEETGFTTLKTLNENTTLEIPTSTEPFQSTASGTENTFRAKNTFQVEKTFKTENPLSVISSTADTNGQTVSQDCQARMWFKKANITNQVLLDGHADWFNVKVFTDCADACCSTQGCVGYVIRRVQEDKTFKCRMFSCTENDCQVEETNKTQVVILTYVKDQTTLPTTTEEETFSTTSTTENMFQTTEDKFPTTENKFPTTENKFATTENKFPTTEDKFPTTENRFPTTENKFQSENAESTSSGQTESEECRARTWFKKANITNQVLLEGHAKWFTVDTFTDCARKCCATEGCTGYVIRRLQATEEFKCRMFRCLDNYCQVEPTNEPQVVILTHERHQTTSVASTESETSATTLKMSTETELETETAENMFSTAANTISGGSEDCRAREWFKKANVTNQVLLEGHYDWFSVDAFTDCAERCCATEGCVGYVIRRAQETEAFKCRMFSCIENICQTEQTKEPQVVILTHVNTQTTTNSAQNTVSLETVDFLTSTEPFISTTEERTENVSYSENTQPTHTYTTESAQTKNADCNAKMWFKKANISNQVLLDGHDWFTVETFTECADTCCSTEGCTGHVIQKVPKQKQFKCRMFTCSDNDCQVEETSAKQAVILFQDKTTVTPTTVETTKVFTTKIWENSTTEAFRTTKSQNVETSRNIESTLLPTTANANSNAANTTENPTENATTAVFPTTTETKTFPTQITEFPTSTESFRTTQTAVPTATPFTTPTAILTTQPVQTTKQLVDTSLPVESTQEATATEFSNPTEAETTEFSTTNRSETETTQREFQTTTTYEAIERTEKAQATSSINFASYTGTLPAGVDMNAAAKMQDAPLANRTCKVGTCCICKIAISVLAMLLFVMADRE